jgi:phosphatidylglycerophosphatase A
MRTREPSLNHDSLSTSGVRRAFRLHPFAAILACGFGSGLSPVAPGTAGSAVALLLAWLLAGLFHPSHGPSLAAGVGLLVSGLAIAAVGVPAATRVARAMSVKDPGCVVIDEFAGQFLASCPVPLFRFETEAARVAAWIVSFLLFRLFDIWKPGPIRRLEELPDGLGIVIDDVLAGLLAAGGTVVASTLLAGAPWH